jgi:predicted secreted hydrolase
VSTFSFITSRTVRGTAVAGLAATALALLIPQVSSAAPGHGDAAAASQPPTTTDSALATGIPTFVHLPADQAAHPSANTEWWYTIGHLSSHGHEYGYEVQLTSGGVVQLAITDVTAGKYSTKLDVRMPNATLSGTLNDMHITATLPQGSLDLRLSAKGAAMYGNGTGLFPFLGGSSYYYSLPNLETSGSLTLNGETGKVTGTSWLDRQWGAWDWTQLSRWTWMAVQLDNGEYLNLWDLFSTAGEQHWATVLHRDGSESIVSVTPLAKDATDFQTSPTTGQRYAGKWTVQIPSLKARLTVTATPTLQEIQAGAPFSPGINEAASTVTGTYQGEPVNGKVYVEQFGIWK